LEEFLVLDDYVIARNELVPEFELTNENKVIFMHFDTSSVNNVEACIVFSVDSSPCFDRFELGSGWSQ
jgi:hypothetical protein